MSKILAEKVVQPEAEDRPTEDRPTAIMRVLDRYYAAVKGLADARRELEEAKLDAENLTAAAMFKTPRSIAEVSAGSKITWVQSIVDGATGKTTIQDVISAARDGGSVLGYRYAAQMLAALAKAGKIERLGHGLYQRLSAVAIDAVPVVKAPAVAPVAGASAEERSIEAHKFLKGKNVVEIADVARILGSTEEDAMHKLTLVGFADSGNGSTAVRN